ncbi:uncharacterized protein RSE6_14628 [Rhynchosporium secalis]|uniref:Uncharacterized protein n=1 Tax=Rhynchosporium secalis TaxID=38038 RepID=A0A1E1MVT1_RHYSE|nr:uncharacterized protein RSE6_14628 [Rhynchosporium secalis]
MPCATHCSSLLYYCYALRFGSKDNPVALVIARVLTHKSGEAALLNFQLLNWEEYEVIAGPPPVKLEGSLIVGESKCPAKASVPR